MGSGGVGRGRAGSGGVGFIAHVRMPGHVLVAVPDAAERANAR